MSEEQFWSFFHELFRSLPRQGPGLNTITDKALKCLPPLGADQRILDIGCGAGVQTLELAKKSAAEIIATDLQRPLLDILKQNTEKEGLAHRITTQVADMGDLPFEDKFFDVLWAEGSSFIIGFAKALKLWKRLIKPGGHLVVSELTWFTDDPPAELREFCLPDSKEDGTVAGRRRAIAEAGYMLLDDFPLPREGWRDAYYAPLQEKLGPFEKRHAEHPDAMAVAKHCRCEIELFKRYEDLYGYTFFILKP